MGKRELPEDLNTLKVTELKEELKQRGLTSSGNKADLVSRLQEFLKNQAKEESGKEAPAEEVNGKEHQEKEKEKEKEKEQEEAKKAQEEEEKAKKEQLEKDQREKEQKEKEEKEKKEKELREKEEKETKEKEAKEKEAKEKEVKDRELREKELKEKEKKEKELKEKELKAEKSKEEEQNKTEKYETEDEPKKRKADEAEPLSTSGRIIKPPTSSSSSSSSSLSSSSSSTPSSKRPRTWSSQPEAITISTDILKDMLPSPSSLSLSSSQVDTEMEEATRNNNNNNNENNNNNNNNNNSNNSGDRRVSQQVYSTPAKRVTKPDPSIRDVPSSKKPASNTLFIDKFVRPFTLNQVKQLLQQTGDIEYFWMNQVKSQAYVTFKTEEQATVTREAIYDLEWPIGNNSRLRAEFASSDEAKKAADHHDQSRSTPSSSGAGQSTPRGSENSASGNLRDSKGVNREERGGERGTKKNAKSSKALEEIFRKTEAKPAIYWLPLSQEQIAAKQKAR